MELLIGKNIKMLRTKRGITQETLANRIGVAPQSVSKWERGEGYPDITFLIPLAEYFGVTLDTLMGIDAEMKEQKICERVEEIERLEKIGAHEEKCVRAAALYREYPYDFRVISYYVRALNEHPKENCEEIESLTAYILDECRAEDIRYDALVSRIETYAANGAYEKAAKEVSHLPHMWGCQEDVLAKLYPRGEDKWRQAQTDYLGAAFDATLWLMCGLAVHSPNLTDAERIHSLERAISAADAIFPDFDFGGCHFELDDICFMLFCLYTDVGEYDKALDALERAFRHARAYDARKGKIHAHTSAPFAGCTYDMRGGWRGIPDNEVHFILVHRLGAESRAAVYMENERFCRLLETYRPYAVGNMNDSK